jgi:hypothetical protein
LFRPLVRLSIIQKNITRTINCRGLKNYNKDSKLVKCKSKQLNNMLKLACVEKISGKKALGPSQV